MAMMRITYYTRAVNGRGQPMGNWQYGSTDYSNPVRGKEAAERMRSHPDTFRDVHLMTLTEKGWKEV